MSHYQSAFQAAKPKLESFFGENLDAIDITVSPIPSILDIAACADEKTIHINPRYWPSKPQSQLSLFAHEVTHILQQKRQRVPITRIKRGIPINQSEALESEALFNELAIHHRTRSPHHSPRPSNSPICNQPPVFQCMVSIDKQPKANLNEFSYKFQQTLSLIPQGPTWLEWAMSQSRQPIINTASEETLLLALLEGLHATSLIKIPALDLLISPLKCMDLPEDDLTAICSSTSSKKAQRVLGKNDLLTTDDMQSAKDFLSNHDIADALCLFAPTLGAYLDLTRLSQDESLPHQDNKTLQKDAAQFAVDQALSPEQFISTYLFYLAAFQRSKTSQATASSNKKNILAAWQNLIPLTQNLLSTASVNPNIAPQLLLKTVVEWITQGGQIGFLTLSNAVQSLAWNLPLSTKLTEATQPDVDQYFAQAQSFLRRFDSNSADNSSGSLSQDGQERSYPIENTEGKAELILHIPTGTVSLLSYTKKQ